MRMVHYFGALALPVLPCLLAVAVTGILGAGGSTHLTLGLATAIYAVAVHTLFILFMIVTGRIIKAAMRTRPLGRGFLDELNVFFARKSAYPVAILAAVAVVATGVLGYAQRGFGISPTLHMLAGVLTLIGNFAALPLEWKALLANQDLLDRCAAELDRLDAEGVEPTPLPNDSWASPSVRWVLFALAWWTPYLYWGVIEHQGSFSQVSIHPWIELSALGFFAAWRLRGTVDPPFEDEPEAEAPGESG